MTTSTTKTRLHRPFTYQLG